MEILIGLVVLVIVGATLGIASPRWSGMETLGVITSILAGVGLAMALLFVPVARMDTAAQIEAFRAIETTAIRGRELGTNESIAFQLKIAEANAWLAEVQYYNGTVWDIWIPDEVMELSPIE